MAARGNTSATTYLDANDYFLNQVKRGVPTATALEPVRRHPGRADYQRQAVLLRVLSGKSLLDLERYEHCRRSRPSGGMRCSSGCGCGHRRDLNRKSPLQQLCPETFRAQRLFTVDDYIAGESPPKHTNSGFSSYVDYLCPDTTSLAIATRFQAILGVTAADNFASVPALGMDTPAARPRQFRQARLGATLRLASSDAIPVVERLPYSSSQAKEQLVQWQRVVGAPGLQLECQQPPERGVSTMRGQPTPTGLAAPAAPADSPTRTSFAPPTGSSALSIPSRRPS